MTLAPIQGPSPTRHRRIRSTGANILWHPCFQCGDPHAPFGFDTDPHGGPARFYCGKPCWPDGWQRLRVPVR